MVHVHYYKAPLGTLLQIICTLLVIILFRYSLYEFCGSGLFILGKSAFFVYFTNVQNDKPPFHEIKGSEEACEIECILRTLCSTFNRIRADGTCKFYNKIVFPRQQSYPDVDSRFIIRCLPSLRE